MEAARLRRAWIYSILAIIVGLLLILVPLITLASVKAENHIAILESLDGSSSDKSKSGTSEVESLALSFVIAVVAFMFLRRRRPQSEHTVLGQRPY